MWMAGDGGDEDFHWELSTDIPFNRNRPITIQIILSGEVAESSFKTWLVGCLKQSPFAYRVIRAIFRLFIRELPARALNLLPMPYDRGLARGFFSGLELLAAGKCHGKLVLKGQPCPPFPAHSLVAMSNLGQDRYQPWPVFWIELRDITLSGESLAVRDAGGKIMGESTFPANGGPGDLDDPALRHWARKPSLRLEGNVTSIVSRWGRSGYWHWLMDSISRLALLGEFPSDTRIIVPPLRGWMRWFLDALDLGDRCIEVCSKDVWVQRFFFSSPSAMTGCHNPFAIHFLRDRYLPFAADRNDLPKRFYIAREGYTRGVRNEAEVRAWFQAHGWSIIAPETLPIPDQIALFEGAEAIAGIHGSAFTNLVWCRPGCRIFELNPENFLLGAFEVVARILDLKHDFLICPADSHAQITVEIPRLSAMIGEN